MKTTSKILLALAFATAGLSTAWGQPAAVPADSLKVITRSTMLGAGPVNILDTYLSAEHFKGTGLSFVTTVERQRPQSRWSTLTEHELNLSTAKDRAKRQQELEAAYNLYIGRLYGWQLLDGRLTLQAGGLLGASLGAVYNTSNSNNPAQARLHLNVMPAAVGTYHFRLFRHPVSARYELGLPLFGVMFSPRYGQSYYEIFSRGDYDRNIVFTTLASAPEWRHLLTLDAPLSQRLTLRIGYLGNMQQSKVNNLRQHVYTHRVLVGITRRFTILPR